VTDGEERGLAIQVARLAEAVTRMSQEQERSAKRDDEHTRDMADFRATLARIETRVAGLSRDSSEAHETTRRVDRRSAADEARETAGDNRRGLYSIIIALAALALSAATYIGLRPPSP